MCTTHNALGRPEHFSQRPTHRVPSPQAPRERPAHQGHWAEARPAVGAVTGPRFAVGGDGDCDTGFAGDHSVIITLVLC